MACREYRALLPRYVDLELDPGQERLLKDHLPGCDSCRGTIRLLKLEDRAIRGALLGGARLLTPRGVRPRLVRLTLVAGILLAIVLVVLYGTYRGLAERPETASGGDPLERPVLVQVDGAPLPAFLAEVSRRAGVEVRLAGEARDRLGLEPVHMVLARPIRLGSLLGLLGEFYGLRPSVEGDTVILD